MKICKKCGKIVSYNSYFKGYYCDQCGNFEGEDDNCTYSTTGCGGCNYTRLLSELDKYKNLEEQGMLLKLNAPIDIIIRCAMCTNIMRSDRGCDGGCRYDEMIFDRIMKEILKSELK